MSYALVISFHYNNKNILLQAFPDMMFGEIALKFFNRIGGLNEDYKFFFNSKEIKSNSYKSLQELNIINGSIIDVVCIKDVICLIMIIHL